MIKRSGWLLYACGVVALVEAAFAQENFFPRLVGEWREINTATSIIISEDGAVFSRSPDDPIHGQVERSIMAGGNFALENDRVRCAYDIVMLKGDTESSWGLRSEMLKPGAALERGSCPKSGHYIRVSSGEGTREAAKRELQSLAAVETARIEAQELRNAAVKRAEQAEQQAFDNAVRSCADRSSTAGYAQRYPTGKFLPRVREFSAECDRREAAEALRRAEQVEQQAFNNAVRTCADRETATAYIQTYPSGKFVARVREFTADCDRQNTEKLAAIARKEAEQRRYKQVAGECDRLAAAPDDKDKPADVAGMPWKDMRYHADEAVEACGQALKVFVDHPRLVFQLGRALQWSSARNSVKRAFTLYSKAAEWGYPGAFDNLGSMYRDGTYVPQNIQKAMQLWHRGAELGDPGCTYNIAYYSLKEGKFNEGLDWLKKASDLGSEPATAMYQKYQAELEQAHQSPYQPTQPGQQSPVPPNAQFMMDVFGAFLGGMR